MKILPKIDILGVGITNATEQEILEYVLQQLGQVKEKTMIVTTNPEFLVFANKKRWFADILNQAQISLTDGIGIVLAAQILGKETPFRIAGVDFMERLCKEASIKNLEGLKKPITVGFLGGRLGVADKAAKRLQHRYPGLRVSLTADEPHKLPTRLPDILFVAFGFPKQEQWISQNLPKLPIRVAMGVGGSFDYIAGEVVRAPYFIRSIGFEWLYRLIRQPWRLKRQLALIEFIFLVLKHKLLKVTQVT